MVELPGILGQISQAEKQRAAWLKRALELRKAEQRRAAWHSAKIARAYRLLLVDLRAEQLRRAVMQRSGGPR